MSSTSIRGSYSTNQFVIRLRGDIKQALNLNDSSHERVQAFSTYLHETIHWWQNMGSFYGFLFSLTFPTTALLAWGEIEMLIAQKILSKPLTKYNELYFKDNGIADIRSLNLILNNSYDLRYAKEFGFDNTSIQKLLEDRRFFISVGHSYSIMWGNNISTLSMFDEQFRFLPKIKNWIAPFQRLRESKFEGFGIDSIVRISRLGIQAIFEGQAIFNQLQYLSSSLNNTLTIKDCKENGMLHGIYLSAFNRFLEISDIDEPVFVSDSKIGLFLLVCDISINPTNGFPMEIHNFENFISHNDPGMRFEILCTIIKQNKEYYQDIIITYSLDEYIEVSNKLCEAASFKSPLMGSAHVLDWFKEDSISTLLNEESQSKFSPLNLPVQVLFSKFLRFQEDKIQNSNIFCWIGHHMTNIESETEYNRIKNLFDKHMALFIEGDDGEIKPTVFEHLDVKNTQNAFNSFYQSVTIYDLILQWIFVDGEFDKSFSWLTNKSKDEIDPFLERNFKSIFGISLNDIKVI